MNKAQRLGVLVSIPKCLKLDKVVKEASLFISSKVNILSDIAEGIDDPEKFVEIYNSIVFTNRCCGKNIDFDFAYVPKYRSKNNNCQELTDESNWLLNIAMSIGSKFGEDLKCVVKAAYSLAKARYVVHEYVKYKDYCSPTVSVPVKAVQITACEKKVDGNMPPLEERKITRRSAGICNDIATYADDLAAIGKARNGQDPGMFDWKTGHFIPEKMVSKSEEKSEARTVTDILDTKQTDKVELLKLVDKACAGKSAEQINRMSDLVTILSPCQCTYRQQVIKGEVCVIRSGCKQHVSGIVRDSKSIVEKKS